MESHFIAIWIEGKTYHLCLERLQHGGFVDMKEKDGVVSNHGLLDVQGNGVLEEEEVRRV